jgi:L-lactate dehydrogenase complex protein LldE
MPEVGVATVALLRRAGWQVTFPEGQTCCGQPFFNSGFRKEARRLAKRTVDLFADFEQTVLPSGSCAAMIRAEYPHLLDDDPKYAYRARRLAQRTFELSEFLVRHAGWTGDKSPPTDLSGDPPGARVTYHDSCHMCRVLKLKEEPRILLQRAGYQLEEMAESDRCCGFGGLFSLRMPEVSNAMTVEKLRQASDTGAPTVVTADPGCLMQIRGFAQKGEPQAEHLAVMLERRTR